MDDLLARFRREQQQPPIPLPSEAPAKETYLAFATKDKLDCLIIKRARAPWRSPRYAYLLDVAYDGAYGTNFVAHFTFITIQVRGRNLQPVVMALQNSTAAFLQEFDASQWDDPADQAAPFIKSIVVVVNQNGPTMADGSETASAQLSSPKLH